MATAAHGDQALTFVIVTCQELGQGIEDGLELLLNTLIKSFHPGRNLTADLLTSLVDLTPKLYDLRCLFSAICFDGLEVFMVLLVSLSGLEKLHLRYSVGVCRDGVEAPLSTVFELLRPLIHELHRIIYAFRKTLNFK